MSNITTSFGDFKNNLNESEQFIDKVTYEMTGPPPKWHWTHKEDFVEDMKKWGYTHTSLTKKTDMLIAADEDLGTLKCQKAEKFGIPIYSYEDAFKKKELLYKRVIRAKKIENLNKIELGKFFVLQDVNNDDNNSYCFKTNIEDDGDCDFLESDEFETFMDKMESSSDKNGLKKWSGVHDGSGGSQWFGYSSYEIEDFDTAIKMWFDFFKKHKKLTSDSKVFITNDDDDIFKN